MEAFLLSILFLLIDPTPPLVVWDKKVTYWEWNGEYTWTVVHNPEWLEGLCQTEPTLMPVKACAKRMSDGSCDIYSSYPEWLAKVTWSYSFEPLWDHEMKHCMGYRHRSIFDEAEK